MAQTNQGCFELPREYLFTGPSLASGQLYNNLSKQLLEDGDFALDEIVCALTDYRFQVSDVARIPFQAGLIPPDDYVIDPATQYPRGAIILVNLQNLSPAPLTPQLLFRGRVRMDARKTGYRFLEGRCQEDPKIYFLKTIIPNANQILENQVVDIDEGCEFMLRQVMVIGGAVSVQFADPNGIFVQDVPVPAGFFGRAYKPQIAYPPHSRILVNVQDTSGQPNSEVQILFVGVNRSHVE